MKIDKRKITRTNLKGQKFGKLKVLKISKITLDSHKIWLCQCECGNRKEVLGTNLNRGFTKSCGKCKK